MLPNYTKQKLYATLIKSSVFSAIGKNAGLLFDLMVFMDSISR